MWNNDYLLWPDYPTFIYQRPLSLISNILNDKPVISQSDQPPPKCIFSVLFNCKEPV